MVEHQGLPIPQRYGAITAIALGIMLSVLDGAIVNVALPSIAKDFHVSEAESIWVINAFQLAIVISLLSLSYLGDRIGYKKVYQCGLLAFIFSSLVCALASNLEVLVAGRMLQGFSSAAVMSVNTALVRQIYSPTHLGRGIAINSMVVALSAAAGPSIAALILSFASWHWLFLINLPIGIISVILAFQFLPSKTPKKVATSFDTPSAVLNGITFALFFLAISGVAHQYHWLLILTMLLACCVSGYFLVKRQLGRHSPLLPVDLLRIPIFSISLITSICAFTAQMATLVVLPFFLQNMLGYSVVKTGLLLTPWPIAVMCVAPLAGRLVERVHAGLLGLLGLSIFATGLAFLALLPANPSNFDFIWRIALCGIGFALFQSPNNYTIISAAPVSRSGAASGMLGTARLTGQTMGATLVAVFFNWSNTPVHTSVWLAFSLAVAGAAFSGLRMSQVQNRP
ncbi:MFS transporter [Pseudomonas sp. F1_0610]|uniref:MFS transporter n=1 Tax=Pseudomonas sp. F1_0610 TaxID=3114284 RepID=UPI0039C3D0FD